MSAKVTNTDRKTGYGTRSILGMVYRFENIYLIWYTIGSFSLGVKQIHQPGLKKENEY